jgi:predicted nucleic acid-binding protein
MRILESFPKTSAQFDESFELFRSRPDKQWSHTDCASFCVMEKEGITEVLTYDRHFQQAGFVALMRS